MLRARLFRICTAAAAGLLTIVGHARAQSLPVPPEGPAAPQAGAIGPSEPVVPEVGLWEVVLAGGLPNAVAITGDRVPPDRSQFLNELIRRIHHLPTPREGLLRPVLAHLAAARQNQSNADGWNDTLPLPLAPAVWLRVLGGGAAEATLVSDILASRGASLLYIGLLSLDADTRAWLSGQPALLAEIVAQHAPAFTLAAPGLRVKDGRVRVPGGEDADPAWSALIGRPPTQPADFLRTLLAHDEGRLAYTFGALGQLTDAQLHVALDLDALDPEARVACLRRLHGAFVRIGGDWRVDTRAFWRPSLDPALLVADLAPAADGRPIVQGTRAFWSAAFSDGDRPVDGPSAEGERADLGWLSERIFAGTPGETRRRYNQLLFASRFGALLAAAPTRDAVDAVRGAGRFPALIMALERMGVRDVGAIAQLARRASRLAAIGDPAHAERAIAQFQGLLALVTRATLRGGLSGSTTTLLTSLAAVETTERGDYEGGLVRWMGANLRVAAGTPAGAGVERTAVASPGAGADPPYEQGLIRFLAGGSSRPGPVLEWEGERYRVDLAHAEAVRVERLLGDTPRHYLSAARTMIRLADAFAETDGGRDARAQTMAGLADVAERVGWADGTGWSGDMLGQYREARAALDRPARDRPERPARVALRLRLLADTLLARGLIEITYAAALGQPERAWITADEAARDHDFGLRSVGPRRRDVAWRLAIAGADTRRDWRATGSLLGLDMRLAEFSLVRVSTRLPARRPTLNEDERRVFIENIALVQPAPLTNEAQRRVVALLQHGRARLAAVRTVADATAVADEIRLGSSRRTLLAWAAARDRASLLTSLSLGELLLLGLDGQPLDERLHAWGASSESRLGCLCLRILDRRPVEMLEGRWGTGIFASGFADLNLRLAELLDQLAMPAALLGSVLSSATLDFVNTVSSRGPDDRRALAEFVRTLTVEHVEQYLALLTTDGPLVPLTDTAETIANTTGVPR